MKFLLPAALAWIIAQGLKHIFGMVGKNRRVFHSGDRSLLMPSGGMPSTHTATVVAFTVFVGMESGWDSGLFGLSLLMAAIVVYDSMGVRYASGRQGEALNSLIKETKSKIGLVRVSHGHRPIEVVAGALIGAGVALIVFFTT